ncbi:MAG: Tn3 family transposase [Acetobacteraceae bacterium]
MRRRVILSPATRTAVFDPPDGHDEAQRRYVLAPEDVALARRHRRSHNRLGFAVQLALVRDLGRPLQISEVLPAAVIDTVAEQIGIDPVVFGLYAKREETRREHTREIITTLSLRPVQVTDYRGLIAAAARTATGTEQGEPIVRAIIERLKINGILIPGADRIERLALAGRAAARRQAHRDLIRGLDAATCAALDNLLTETADHRTVFGWIAEAPEGVKLKNLKGMIARLDVLRRIGISDERCKTIHANRYGIIAREAKILHARELGRLSVERRRATLVAFVIERQAVLTDLAVETFGKLVGSARRKAETTRHDRLLQQGPALAAIAEAHHRLGLALLAAREAGTDLGAAVAATLGWSGLEASVALAAGAVPPAQGEGLRELADRQRSLRPVARLVFDAFTFRSFRAQDPLLAAIDLLREVHRGKRLPPHVPLSFLSRQWRRHIRKGKGGFDAPAWEVAVLLHLRHRLGAGDVWVEGSRAWRSFEDFLLPRATFALMRSEGRLGLATPDSFSAWRDERAAILDARLKALAAAAAANTIPDAAITPDGLTLAPIRRDERDQAQTLSRRLYNIVPRVRMPALLAEVHRWTGFLDCFTHYRSGEAAADPVALMAAIMADATNSGVERMAESSRGVTLHQMMLMVERHIRPETYAAATAALVDAQHAQPFAAIWGDGRASSSDGQFFPAGGRGEAAGDYNAKRGSAPGAALYGFISNRYASFYSKLIQASESEAPYVLDGLLHNESSIEILEHATDTAGATEMIFAMFPQFGYRLTPRIRNLGDRKLFVIRPSADYAPLAPLIGGTANLALVEENWDEMLRLWASIGAGLVPPSVILKKIAAAPRQNALAKALREIGRIEHSIFICDWLLDPLLRRRAHGNLNKGETRHSLARAVFLHQLGELRDRVAETMAYRACGLNLVVNAIILWNTIYLSRAVRFVREQGVDLQDHLLAQVAPIPWGHIGLTGDYLWNEIDHPLERFRPLRTNHFNPKAFVFP